MTDVFEAPPTAKDPGRNDEEGIRRDRYGRYLLPDPEGRKEQPWTRATTFAKTISDTYTLDLWSQRMVAVGLALRPDLLALAAAGAALKDKAEQKAQLQPVCDAAKDAAAARAGSNLGTALHRFTDQIDRGDTPFVPPPWDSDVAAYRAALAEHGLEVDPEYIEQIVIVQRFSVAGKFDRLTRVAGSTARRVFDLKTGRDLSYGWGEIAVQLALYANADRIWDRDAQTYRPMPEIDREKAIVAHLPVGSGTCTMYEVDIGTGWTAAELCDRVRQWRRFRTLATPLSKTVVEPSGTPAMNGSLSYAERIAVATSSGELDAIWREATSKGLWTPALLDLGKKRQAELAL